LVKGELDKIETIERSILFREEVIIQQENVIIAVLDQLQVRVVSIAATPVMIDDFSQTRTTW
jgi:hypothetical protein